MIKKRLLAILLCILIILAVPMTSFAYVTSFSAVTFTVKANTSAGFYVNQTLTVSGSGSNYNATVTVLENVDATKLKLSWSPTTYVTVTNSSNKTVTSGNAPLAAAGQSITYTVKIQTAKSKYSTATYTFTTQTAAHSEGVAAMHITLDESIKELNADGTTYRNCTISAMNNDANHETSCYGSFTFEGQTYYLSMKGRGNYTWKWEKKPYNFTLYTDGSLKEDGTWDGGGKAEAELIEGVSSKKWSLLANYADSTLLRNKIGYDLAERLGIGLESRFVDIWINGNFWGNYLLTPKTDYNASKNGYMVELDNKQETLSVDAGGDPQFFLNGIATHGSFYNAFTVKDIGSKAEKAGETPETIQKWMQKMLDAVRGVSNENYLDYIDLDSWAKMYLLHEFYKNYDVISGSIFMRREGLTADDKLIAGPVWDLDNAIGRYQNCPDSGLTEELQHSGGSWYIDSIDSSKVNSFFQYLGKHADFMERVYQIYNEYKDAFDDVPANIVRQEAALRDSRICNFLRWNVDQSSYNVSRYTSQKTYGSGTKYAVTMIKTTTYDDYLANLKTYVNARLNFLSDQLTVAKPTCDLSGEKTYSAGDTIRLTATAGADGYAWQSSADGKAWDTISGATGNVYTVSATAAMDGTRFRCVARKNGAVIQTTRVPKVNTSALATSDAVEIHVHTFTDTVTPPTCMEKGYTTHTCSCGAETVDTYTDALGHDYVDTVTPPTCTEKGYTTHSCSRCPDQFVDSYTEPTGHHYENGFCTGCGAVPQTDVSGDANGDGVCNLLDLIRLQKYLSDGTAINTAGADVNGDGAVNEDDYACLQQILLHAVPQTDVSGDANGDGVFDVRDLIRLKRHFADAVAINPLGGDPNNDGTVDINDLTLLKQMLLA